MYNDVGESIKRFAKLAFIFEAIVFIIVGIVLMANEVGDDSWVVLGPACMIGGPFIAFLSSLFIYGFGEIIDKLSAIERNTSKGSVDFTEQKDSPVKTSESYEEGHETIEVSSCYSSDSLQQNENKTCIGSCEICDAENVPVVECITQDYFGVRIRNLCANCYDKNRAYIIE